MRACSIRLEGEPRLLAVDTVIVCAGQEPARGLYDELLARGLDAQPDRRRVRGGGTRCQASYPAGDRTGRGGLAADRSGSWAAFRL